MSHISLSFFFFLFLMMLLDIGTRFRSHNREYRTNLIALYNIAYIFRAIGVKALAVSGVFLLSLSAPSVVAMRQYILALHSDKTPQTSQRVWDFHFLFSSSFLPFFSPYRKGFAGGVLGDSGCWGRGEGGWGWGLWVAFAIGAFSVLFCLMFSCPFSWGNLFAFSISPSSAVPYFAQYGRNFSGSQIICLLDCARNSPIWLFLLS